MLGGLDLEGYLDPYAFGEGAPFRPSAAVIPASVEEIQRVLTAARQHQLPLWTVSRGRNYGYGGAAPRVSGSVVLDLHRMNRILEVDQELGYVLVEPGVSFLDMHAHLRANKHRLVLSVPDIGWGSLIGNALERGFGYAAHGEHIAFSCGLEVVLADGSVVRTGMGAVPGGTAWHLYRGGCGPALEGLFQQSSLGIVTKMGFWLMPQPENVVVCMVKAPRRDDLGALVDAIRPLLMDGTVQTKAVIGNATIVASMMGERAAWFAGDGPMPASAVRSMMADLEVGWWNARFALYGPTSLTTARLDVVRAAVAAVPDLVLDVRSYPGDVNPEMVHPADRAQLGIPSTDLVRMAAWQGGEPAHTDISLVCPATAADTMRQLDLIQSTVETAGFDYAGGFTLDARAAIALALLSFDRKDERQRERVRDAVGNVIVAAAAAGYAPYRSHLAFMDRIADTYGFNEHALRSVQVTLKDALDPEGLLSPGKQGIWPTSSAPAVSTRQ